MIRILPMPSDIADIASYPNTKLGMGLSSTYNYMHLEIGKHWVRLHPAALPCTHSSQCEFVCCVAVAVSTICRPRSCSAAVGCGSVLSAGRRRPAPSQSVRDPTPPGPSLSRRPITRNWSVSRRNYRLTRASTGSARCGAAPTGMRRYRHAAPRRTERGGGADAWGGPIAAVERSMS